MRLSINWYGPENTWTLELFKNITSNKKIGIINWWLLTQEQCCLEQIEKFIDQNDITFFYSDENIHSASSGENYNFNELFLLLNKKNVFYIMMDKCRNGFTLPKVQNSFYAPWFFKNSLYISPDWHLDLDYRTKLFDFNALLGSDRHVRTIIYKIIKHNSKIYSTYYGNSKFKNSFENKWDEKDIHDILYNQKLIDTKLQTMSLLNRNNSNYILSHIVPTSIYNNTHFDIVCETLVRSDNIFLTEKTAKPLATGRFFCWYTSPNLIDYLKSYGFSFDTYGSYYDTITDPVYRLFAFLEEIEDITHNECRIKQIYQATKAERIHNMEVYKRNMTNFLDNLKNWIYNKINIQ